MSNSAQVIYKAARLPYVYVADNKLPEGRQIISASVDMDQYDELGVGDILVTPVGTFQGTQYTLDCGIVSNVLGITSIKSVQLSLFFQFGDGGRDYEPGLWILYVPDSQQVFLFDWTAVQGFSVTEATGTSHQSGRTVVSAAINTCVPVITGQNPKLILFVCNSNDSNGNIYQAQGFAQITATNFAVAPYYEKS